MTTKKTKQKTFMVEFYYESEAVQTGVIELEAKSAEEAERIVREMDMAGDLEDYLQDPEITGSDFGIENISEV